MAGKTIIIQEVTLSFAQNLFTPGVPKNSGPGTKPRRNCQFIMAPDSAAKKLIDATIKEIALEAWKKDSAQILASIDGNPNRMCFIDGNKRIGWDGYAGNWGLSSLRYPEKGPIIYLDRGKNPITESDGLLYGGAIVNAKVDLFTYDSPSKGVGSALQVVQFVRHGQAFGGGGAASANDMDALPFEEDEEETAESFF